MNEKRPSRKWGTIIEGHMQSTLAKNGRVNAYPLLNWLAARILLKWSGTKEPVSVRDISDWIRKAERTVNLKDFIEPDFWNSITLADCKVTKGLAEDSLDDDKDTIMRNSGREDQRRNSPGVQLGCLSIWNS